MDCNTARVRGQVFFLYARDLRRRGRTAPKPRGTPAPKGPVVRKGNLNDRVFVYNMEKEGLPWRIGIVLRSADGGFLGNGGAEYHEEGRLDGEYCALP